MTRILVLWAEENAPNLGVRALADGAFALLRSALGSEVTIEHQGFGDGTWNRSLGGRAVLADLTTERNWIGSRIAEYDAVYDTGAGDSFTDIYGLTRLATIAYVRRSATKQGVPLLLGPQTIGPFQSVFGRYIGARSLRSADRVVARDSISSRYSAELGIEAPRATDVVFALPTPGRSSTRDVVVNPSGLLWNTDRHGSSVRYRQEMRVLIEGLLRFGRRVTLLAHVLDNPTIDNDVPAVEALHQEFPDTDVLIPKDLWSVRAELASARVVIGARMHACLNALSVGTPTIPWAYSRKFAPLLSDLGWSLVEQLGQLGIAERTLGILESADEEDLVRSARRAAAAGSDRLGVAREAIQDVMSTKAERGTHQREPAGDIV